MSSKCSFLILYKLLEILRYLVLTVACNSHSECRSLPLPSWILKTRLHCPHNMWGLVVVQLSRLSGRALAAHKPGFTLFTYLYFHLITSKFIYFQREARCSEHVSGWSRIELLQVMNRILIREKHSLQLHSKRGVGILSRMDLFSKIRVLVST